MELWAPMRDCDDVPIDAEWGIERRHRLNLGKPLSHLVQMQGMTPCHDKT